jgi:hypothetical protein
MGLNHETSQDKKQIKVWIKQQEVVVPYDEDMIEIKVRPKKKALKQK